MWSPSKYRTTIPVPNPRAHQAWFRDFPEAKSWQRDAKTKVAEPRLRTSLATERPRLGCFWAAQGLSKLDIMKIRYFSLNKGNSLTNLAPNYTCSVTKNHLQVRFVNFTSRLMASLGRENPSLGFLCQILESVSSLHVHWFMKYPRDRSQKRVINFQIRPMLTYYVSKNSFNLKFKKTKALRVKWIKLNFDCFTHKTVGATYTAGG